MSRFCFKSESGRYEYFIEYEQKFGELQLLLYYDEPQQWNSVYKTSKVSTCMIRNQISRVENISNNHLDD